MPGSISNASTFYGTNEARGKAILIEQGSSTGGSADILYTVPAGKTFFLVSASLSFESELGVTRGECFLYIDLAGNTLIKLHDKCYATYMEEDSGHAELTWPMPIPFGAGTEIKVMANTANIWANAYIVGWIE